MNSATVEGELQKLGLVDAKILGIISDGVLSGMKFTTATRIALVKTRGVHRIIIANKLLFNNTCPFSTNNVGFLRHYSIIGHDNTYADRDVITIQQLDDIVYRSEVSASYECFAELQWVFYLDEKAYITNNTFSYPIKVEPSTVTIYDSAKS